MSAEIAQIKVTLLFFARAAEIAETKSREVSLPEGSRVADVSRWLETDMPQLADLLQYSRWAIANEFVEPETVLDADATIALIPPVSGG